MSQITDQKYTHIYVQMLSSGSVISEGRLKLPITIGRHSSNKICFNNAMAISRYHLKIETGADQYLYVTNLSKNGYLLNNKKYFNAQKIKENDIIGFSDFSKSIRIITLYKASLPKKEEDESKPSISVYHSQSKVIQLSQILQQRMRSQFKSIHALYLTSIVILLCVFILIGYYFIKSNKSLLEHFKSTNEPTVIFIKEKESDVNAPTSDIPDHNANTQHKLKLPVQPNMLIQTIPDIHQLNRNFSKLVVELVLKYDNKTIVQNGFFHNGVCFSPIDESLSIQNLRSALAYFASRTNPVELSLTRIETPFLRFKVKNDDFIPLVKTVETDLSLTKPSETILLLEYRRKNNRFLLTKHQATVIDVETEKIVCKCPDPNIKPGCLAISTEQKILGLVTDIDNNHTYLIETLTAIENKTRPLTDKAF